MDVRTQTLVEKRKFIKGKIIIGIDSSKDKQQIRAGTSSILA